MDFTHDHHQHHTHGGRGWDTPDRRRGRTRGHRGERGFGGRDFGPGFGPGFGGRVRRGDLRGLLLAGLLDGPAHGYELMQRLEERTGGRWKPSAGSVYPVLQQLEDEGLATQTEADGRKVYELTEAGREQADPNVLEQFAAGTEGAAGIRELMLEIKQLHLASRQVAISGDAEVAKAATELIREARKGLYKLLAEQ